MITNILKTREMIRYIKEVVFKENKTISSESWTDRDSRISGIAITLTNFFEELKSYGDSNNIKPLVEKTIHDETEMYILSVDNELCKIARLVDDDFTFIEKINNVSGNFNLISSVIKSDDFLISQ